jgi:hypothetical protein
VKGVAKWNDVWISMQELGAAMNALEGGLPVHLVMLDSALSDVEEFVQAKALVEQAEDPESWRPLIDSETGFLITIEDYKGSVECGGFTDDDGHGYPVRDGKVNEGFPVHPSDDEDEYPLPEGTTHILWFNK